MCGIFGFVVTQDAQLTNKSLRSILSKLFKLSEKRGREAAGIALMSGTSVDVFKKPGRAHEIASSNEYLTFLKAFLDRVSESNQNETHLPALIAIGHSRLVTNGAESLAKNNQPVISNNSVGIHNGIVVNDAELWNENADLARQSELDSEIIFRLIDKYCQRTGKLVDATVETFSKIDGAASIAMISDWTEGLLLATNTGSIYTTSTEKPCIFLFASERFTLEKLVKREVFSRMEFAGITRIPAGEGVIVNDLATISARFKLGPFCAGSAPNCGHLPTLPVHRTISSHMSDVRNLRRCTRCLLPETFPFISFDEAGVCSVCRDHKEKQLYGIDSLRKIADQHRRKDGAPDCLVAFSGGRDSSYGLHYISENLGLNPIAFTYDWGMVTDLARRNQARICGKLGIEHIIRSPHIPTKRRNIRHNLEAWLHRPDLGMIPLLMAGDKQMFQVARDLRKETNINLVLFCAGNELERTEFKTGFCGIRENAHGQVFWKYSLLNKIKLGLYYAQQYVRNPRYINSSITDTISAYYSTYIGTDDFVYLYHYLPWDEHVIENTLNEKYGWETAKDSSTTWRVGDGTTAFYNYIYHTVAGFSEHDTFRSNQIRAGLISREEAMKKLEIDNLPRFQSIRDYASLVGFNADEAITRINSIPKLY